MLRSLYLVAFCIATCAPAWAERGEPGPFLVGTQTVTVTRPNASSFTARLFYPATIAGENAPIDDAQAPYPAISFGHGFLQPVGNYQSTLAHLASHGYLVIATNSEGGLFPNHSNFAADLLHSLTYLQDQHVLPASPLFQRVDVDAFALSGHSMGGGAAILAAADPRIRAIAPLAAANTNPSSIAALSNLLIPVRHIVGSVDAIVSPNTTQQMFNNSARPRQFLSLQGGFHCGFIDAQGFGCDNGSLSRSDQLLLVRRLLTEFFDLHLKADQSIWTSVWLLDCNTDSRVVATIDPDSSITPHVASLSVRAGSAATLEFTVTNQGPQPTAFELELLPLVPSAGLSLSETPTLEPQAATSVQLSVAPDAKSARETVNVLVSARSLRDGATRSVGRVEISVRCAGDFNADAVVDFFDVQWFLAAFDASSVEADLNDDHEFDFFDLIAFLNAFSVPCP